MTNERAPTSPLLTPSALTRLAREVLESNLANVWIEGELTNVSRPASGHLYFTLKDAGAQVRCAMFKPRSTWLPFKPADGLKVLARGRVSLYEARGEFQLIIEHMEQSGEGAWPSSSSKRGSLPRVCSPSRTSALSRPCRSASASSHQPPVLHCMMSCMCLAGAFP